MAKNKDFIKLLICSGVSFVIFILLIALLSVWDVRPIGPENSSVGMAGINGFFANLFPYNSKVKGVTDILGYLSFLTAGIFAVLGVIDLIRKKSFKKINKSFYPLAGLYVAAVILYIAFDKIVINYRPVILDEGLEPSFPSTHSLLSVVILSSAIVELAIFVKNKKACLILQIAAAVLMVAIVLGRMISGVHWFTDIVGGVVLGIALIFAYLAFIRALLSKNN